MSAFEDSVKIMVRNTLLGRWAAERLGRSGTEIEAYVQDFSQRAAREGDVFTCLRDDLAAGGFTGMDDEINRAVTDCTIRAGNQLTSSGGGSPDAAAVALKRQFMPR
jgi:hypothetical protein